MDWYIADGDRQKGPFRLQDLPAQGLRPESLVWRLGMTEWQRAERVDDITLAGLLPRSFVPNPPVVAHTGQPPFAGYPATQPPGVPVAYATPGAGPNVPPFNPAQSNRVAAGLCGILLGGLGVHKFILGMPGPGVTMLLVSFVGGFFTCGLTSAVMGLIGLVEGIIYLTKSEEEFYYLYVVQKKQWF